MMRTSHRLGAAIESGPREEQAQPWYFRGAALCWVLSVTVHSAAVALLAFSIAPVSPRRPTIVVRGGTISLVLRASFNGGRVTPEAAAAPVMRTSYQPAADEHPLSSETKSIPSADAADQQLSPANHPSDQQQQQAQLFGLAAPGQRIVYVIDRSASMEGRRLAAARRELIASLQSLGPRQQFQIVFYNQEPQMMSAGRSRPSPLTPADEPAKRLAAAFVGSILADGPTNHVRALASALALRPETIFFLTDAQPPGMTADELQHVQRLNRGTSIQCIEFGVGRPPPGYNFLMQLAAENGGKHTYVDIARLPP